MKGFQFEINGNWGHFKKPETNNNPLTHDLLTKTALIGLIGAVLGIERQPMREKFPKFSEDFLYSVSLLNPVKKVSWGFSSRTAINPVNPGSPKYFEFLKNPHFKVSLALKEDRSILEFNAFIQALKTEECVYTPVLGWHNCPANLKFLNEGTFSKLQNGKFETQSFVKPDGVKLSFEKEFRVGFDKLPTYQTNDFWNKPDRYREIIYPDYPNSLNAEGLFYEYQTEKIKEQCWLM